MNTTMTALDLDALLRRLAGKYAVDVPTPWRLGKAADLMAAETDTVLLLPGWALLVGEPAGEFLPLLPWRNERRFVELKRLADDRTVESVSLCRFSCMTDGQALDLLGVLYREFDLAEWIAGSPIVSVMANITAGRWANVLVRLANGIVCGVEAGVTLPVGTAAMDRHELIAQRGVACDRVVDSQVPQNSIYTFTAAGPQQFTDVDSELFGLAADDVSLVRAAYDLLLHADRAAALRQQHRRLAGLVRLALESEQRQERLSAEGVQ